MARSSALLCWRRTSPRVPIRLILVDDEFHRRRPLALGLNGGGRAGATPSARLTVISLESKSLRAGLASCGALSRGVAASQAPILLLTDADIVHDPRHLSSLVAKAPARPAGSRERDGCTSTARAWLNAQWCRRSFISSKCCTRSGRVNNPRSRVAASGRWHRAHSTRCARTHRRHRCDPELSDRRRCGVGEVGEKVWARSIWKRTFWGSRPRFAPIRISAISGT